MTLHEQADDFLQTIGDLTARIEALESAYEQEIAAIRAKYRDEIESLTDIKKMEDKGLVALMKKNRAELFDGKEKLRLAWGILIHTKEPTLSIPRDVVERLKEKGWTEVIKTVESADREAINKWPLEKIIAIGGDKKPKEKFLYETQRREG